MILSVLKKRMKGSLTVEACIALPVFLTFFFLLLFFTKIACLDIVLDQALKESARQIAAMSYPLNFFNDYIDNQIVEGEPLSKFFSHEVTSVQAIAAGTLEESLLTSILSGKLFRPDLEKTWQNLKEQITGDSLDLVEGMLVNTLFNPFLDLKETGQYQLAREVFENQLLNSRVNPQQINFTLVKLPQSISEYEHKKAGMCYRDGTLTPDEDFHKDDVVLQLEYKVKLPLPFLGVREVLLSHTAVERAWLYGGNGVYAAERNEEGIDFDKYKPKNQNAQQGEGAEEQEEQEEEVEYVFICKSRTKVYHSFRHCQYIVDKSGVRRISLEEAQKRGLRAHGGCPERFK